MRKALAIHVGRCRLVTPFSARCAQSFTNTHFCSLCSVISFCRVAVILISISSNFENFQKRKLHLQLQNTNTFVPCCLNLLESTAIRLGPFSHWKGSGPGISRLCSCRRTISGLEYVGFSSKSLLNSAAGCALEIQNVFDPLLPSAC